MSRRATSPTTGWGSRSRVRRRDAILEELAHDDVSNEAFRVPHDPLDGRRQRARRGRAHLADRRARLRDRRADRRSTAPSGTSSQDAGAAHGLRPIGDRAVDSLRLEKGYGIWSAEFRQDYTPGMSGLDRFVAFDKGEFIGRERRDAGARDGRRATARAAGGRRRRRGRQRRRRHLDRRAPRRRGHVGRLRPPRRDEPRARPISTATWSSRTRRSRCSWSATRGPRGSCPRSPTTRPGAKLRDHAVSVA